MILVYHREPSNGGRSLAQALTQLGTSATNGCPKSKITHVVCWGYHVPEALRRLPTLNGVLRVDKLTELITLQRARVPTLEIWVPRAERHEGGRDIIQVSTGSISHYTKFVNTIREFRVHVFDGKSIRVGIKVNSGSGHPWIRSHQQGWSLDYGSNCRVVITNSVRVAARQAIEAMSYDFGAVDVGIMEDGRPIVFEVNSAPGLDNENTALAYARHIIQWSRSC